MGARHYPSCLCYSCRRTAARLAARYRRLGVIVSALLWALVGFLAATVLNGCARPVDLEIAPNVPQELYPPIRAALKVLQYDSGCLLGEQDPGASHVIVRLGDLGGPHSWIADTQPDETLSIITLNEERRFGAGDVPDCVDVNDTQTVLTHELGHVAGFQHVSDPNAVMFPGVGPCQVRRELTPADWAGNPGACY